MTEPTLNPDQDGNVTVVFDDGLSDEEREAILAERAVASAARDQRRAAAETQTCPTCGRAKAVN